MLRGLTEDFARGGNDASTDEVVACTSQYCANS